MYQHLGPWLALVVTVVTHQLVVVVLPAPDASYWYRWSPICTTEYQYDNSSIAQCGTSMSLTFSSEVVLVW
jgi:hypothetical protein